MSGDWSFLTCLWIVSAAVVVTGFRPVSEQRLARWSTRFGVATAGTTECLVRARLRRARGVRWISFTIGLNLSMLPMYMNVIDARRAADVANPLTSSTFFLAPTLGALVAELLVVQRPVGQHTAELIRRRARDYVDRFWTRVIVTCGVLSTAAAVTATMRRAWEWRFAWVAPAAALAAFTSVTFGVRRIVNRPLAAPDGPLRAADEALRADGAHHIAGAAVALAVTTAVTALTLALPDGPWELPLGFVSFLGTAWWIRLAIGERWSVALARRVHT